MGEDGPGARRRGGQGSGAGTHRDVEEGLDLADELGLEPRRVDAGEGRHQHQVVDHLQRGGSNKVLFVWRTENP